MDFAPWRDKYDSDGSSRLVGDQERDLDGPEDKGAGVPRSVRPSVAEPIVAIG